VFLDINKLFKRNTITYHTSRRVSELDAREGTSNLGVIVESSSYPFDLASESTETRLHRTLGTHRRYELDKLKGGKAPRLQRILDESQRFGAEDFLDVKKVLACLDAFIKQHLGMVVP
jgi:hypothetical protein